MTGGVRGGLRDKKKAQERWMDGRNEKGLREKMKP